MFRNRFAAKYRPFASPRLFVLRHLRVLPNPSVSLHPVALKNLHVSLHPLALKNLLVLPHPLTADAPSSLMKCTREPAPLVPVAEP